MSCQIPITKTELRRIERELKTKAVIICLDAPSQIKTLLVARDMLMRGKNVKARIEGPA